MAPLTPLAVELQRSGLGGYENEDSRKEDALPVSGMRLNWTVGRAALPYGVSVGRLHASDVLPRVRFDSAEAEAEEGLAFAEAFGVGISLHFKLGKLLLSLLVAASLLQLPALFLYARHGQLFTHPYADPEPDWRENLRWQINGAWARGGAGASTLPRRAPRRR